MSGRAITLLAALVVALVGGCYAPDFGPASAAPFRCDDGRCPDGYRCASAGSEALCVPTEADDPPVALGRVNLEHGAPQLFWSERGLNVFWLAASQTRLNAATWDDQRLIRHAWQSPSLPGGVAFAARYHPQAARVIVAWEDYFVDGVRLSVASFDEDLGTAAKPEILLEDQRPLPPEGFGFSRPGLAVASADEVIVAYTYGAPPDHVADNVYCARLSLSGGASDDACRPPAGHTAGSFAVDALPLADDGRTVVVWRDDQVHLSARVGQAFRERIDLDLGEVAGARLLGQRVVMLARPLVEAGSRGGWRLLVATEGKLEVVDLQRAGLVVPGLALDAARDRAVVCLPTEDRRLELRSFALPELTPVATVEVPRLSSDRVFDCQIDVSPVDGRLGLAWRETTSQQAYVTIVPPLD